MIRSQWVVGLGELEQCRILLLQGWALGLITLQGSGTEDHFRKWVNSME